MFERFTDRAREVVNGTEAQARQLGDHHIGTEHLLLSLLDLDDGIAHDVLTEAGIDAGRVRQAVKSDDQSGSDAEALESIGIDLNAVKAKLEEAFGPGALDEQPPARKGWFGRKGDPGGRRIPFTPRSKVVIELSLREALALKQNYIGTEHILLGLIREGEGLAAKLLTEQGIDLKLLRTKTIQTIKARKQQ